MNDNPVLIFEQLFAVVGHTQKEQKELAATMYNAILSNTISLLLSKLTPDQRSAIESKYANGSSDDEVLSLALTFTEPNKVETLIRAVTFAAIRHYLASVDSQLTQVKKMEIIKLFDGIGTYA